MADEYNNQNNLSPQGSTQQQYYPPQSVQPPKEEKASVGLAILSYLIPIVGLILFLTKRTTNLKPQNYAENVPLQVLSSMLFCQ